MNFKKLLDPPNPLGPGQDPTIVYTQGNYHLFTAAQEGVVLSRSNDLGNIIKAPQTQKAVYNRRSSAAIIAPDATYIDNISKWVLYFNEVDQISPRCLLSDSNDPAGSWSDKGLLQQVSVFAYDPHLLLLNGNAYIFLSTYQTLHIAPVDPNNPCNVIAPFKPILTVDPALSWEVGLIEAPATVVKGNTINLIFSTDQWFLPAYKNGLATANINSDLTQQSSWTVNPQPVFASNGNVQGPGSGTFFNDDQNNVLFGYGALTDPFTYNENGQGRNVRAQTVSFDADGNVIMPVPAQTN